MDEVCLSMMTKERTQVMPLALHTNQGSHSRLEDRRLLDPWLSGESNGVTYFRSMERT